MNIKLNSILAMLLLSFCSTEVIAQGIQVTNLDGGSVVTDMGAYGFKLNAGSSLHRTWIVLNDPACPIQLSDAGIEVDYAGGGYTFTATGSARASKPVRAYEVRYLLYDTFGAHLTTLSYSEVKDLDAGETFPLSVGSWYAFKSQASELLTVVAFVAQTRDDDGKIWRFDQKAITDELGKIQLKVSGVLEPTKDSDKK